MISQIPGLRYGKDYIASMPRLKSWTDRVIKDSFLVTMNCGYIERSIIQSAFDEDLKYKANSKNATWVRFKQFCEEHKITQYTELSAGPDWIQTMLNDPQWKKKMQSHIAYSMRHQRNGARETEDEQQSNV